MLLTTSAGDILKIHCYHQMLKCKNDFQIKKEQNSVSSKKTRIRELKQHAKSVIQIF